MPAITSLGKIFVLILFAIALAPQTSAQPNVNVIYGDIGGPGIGYSIGYERLLSPNQRFAVRGGFSTAVLIEKNTRERLSWWTFPFGGSWFVGRKSHKLELGVGVSFGIARSNLDVREGAYRNFYFTLPYTTIGYRYQPQQRRLYYRIAFTPVYGGEHFDPIGSAITPWGSLGLGWRL